MKHQLTLAALILISSASLASDLDEVVRSVGVPAGTQLDVAIFSADGLCHDGRYPAAAADTRLRYHAASISKLFTATVVMQLRDEGKLKLQDPVGYYVPEFASSPIRIEHLLTHTSGLRDRIRASGRTTPVQADDYIRKLARQKPAGEPGAQWSYSDNGFNLLGRVIENITRKEFAIAMQERLLAPLGMSISTHTMSPQAGVTLVRATDAGGRVRAHPWDLVFAPSSGLQSDARDLARFGAAVLAVAAGRQSPGVPAGPTLAEMTTVRVPTEWSGVSQGYGWQLATDAQNPVWRHAGGEAGFESLLALYPKSGFGIVVMGNREDWPRFPLNAALAKAVREGRLKCGSEPPRS